MKHKWDSSYGPWCLVCHRYQPWMGKDERENCVGYEDRDPDIIEIGRRVYGGPITKDRVA